MFDMILSGFIRRFYLEVFTIIFNFSNISQPLKVKIMIIIDLMRYFVVAFIVLFNCMICQAWDSGLHRKYDGYGEDWIFMPDGDDQPQVAVLKRTESDERGIFDESQVSYILYTRYSTIHNLYIYKNILYNSFVTKIYFKI